MNNLKKGQPIKFRDGRTGTVIEIDKAKAMVRCSLDMQGGGATATGWYNIADVTPDTKREDSKRGPAADDDDK
jgi:hypothetical protein